VAQKAGQRWDPFRAANPEGAQGPQLVVLDPAATIGDPIEGGVVEADELTVGGRAHVGLEVAHNAVARRKAANVFLRSQGGAAAVGDGHRLDRHAVGHGPSVRTP
jgi:hypothetical protein